MTEAGTSRGSGKLWYSESQRRVSKDLGVRHPYSPPKGKLRDGRIVEYTEMKSGEWLDEPSLWPDAVYLGEGEYVGQ